MRNARAHKLQWSDPTVHSSTVALATALVQDEELAEVSMTQNFV